MKKVLVWLVPLLLLVGGGVAYYTLAAGSKTPEIEYRTAAVEKRRIVGRVTTSGTLQARVTVQVGSQVSGRVQKLFADFNDAVKKGQLVAKIDPQLFQAAVQQASANHRAARAQVAQAEAQALNAQAQLDRTTQLAKEGLATQVELDTAKTNAAVARAQVDSAKAQVDQARASLHKAQVDLSYTDILSPIDGVVISRDVDVGQTVAASLQAPVIFTIAEDLRKMQVNTSVAEGDVGRLEPGMTCMFTVDAFPGQRFRGTIGQIRNAAQTVQNVVTYNAVIDVANDDLKLRPGMTANVTIIYAEKDDALAVTNQALRFRAPPELAGTASASAGGRGSGNGSGRGRWRDRTAAPPADPPPSGPTAAAATASADASGVPSASPSASATASGSAGPTGSAAASGAPGGPGPGRGDGGQNSRQIWVMRGGKPEQITLQTGLSDGSFTEVISGDLKEGDEVVIEATVKGGETTSRPAGLGAGGPGRRMF